MIRLILIACIVCCIAYVSPTRERTDVTAQVGAAISSVETLAAVASSSLVSSSVVASGLGQRVIEEAIRRPHVPVADTHADRLANAAERPYR